MAIIYIQNAVTLKIVQKRLKLGVFVVHIGTSIFKRFQNIKFLISMLAKFRFPIKKENITDNIFKIF